MTIFGENKKTNKKQLKFEMQNNRALTLDSMSHILCIGS